MIRQDMAEVKSTLKTFTDGFIAWTARVESVETRLEIVEEKVIELALMKDTVMQLREQLNTQAQSNISNEVEIMGINETSNENLHHIIMSTAIKIGVKMEDTDIDWASRAGPRKIDASSSTQNFPRPIIVKLLRRGIRDELLKASKLRRNLSTEDIVNAGQKRKIFINERLTKENRMLFRDARISSREKGFKYCWVKNGLIHIRYDDGKPAVTIRNKEELDRLLGSAR